MPDITVAMRALERAVATVPDTSTWRSVVANRVHGLRDAYLLEVQCASGSEAFALDTSPWMHGRLQRLRRDQTRIVDELEALAHACAEAVELDTLRARVHLTLQRIAHLRQRENDLLYESVHVDLGGEQ